MFPSKRVNRQHRRRKSNSKTVEDATRSATLNLRRLCRFRWLYLQIMSFQPRGGMTVWDRASLSPGPLRRAADRWHDITGKAGNTMQRSGCPLIWGALIENLRITGPLPTHCAIETTHKPSLVVSLFIGGNQRIYTLMCGREIKPFGVVTFIDEWIKIHSRLSLSLLTLLHITGTVSPAFLSVPNVFFRKLFFHAFFPSGFCVRG